MGGHFRTHPQRDGRAGDLLPHLLVQERVREGLQRHGHHADALRGHQRLRRVGERLRVHLCGAEEPHLQQHQQPPRRHLPRRHERERDHPLCLEKGAAAHQRLFGVHAQLQQDLGGAPRHPQADHQRRGRQDLLPAPRRGDGAFTESQPFVPQQELDARGHRSGRCFGPHRRGRQGRYPPHRGADGEPSHLLPQQRHERQRAERRAPDDLRLQQLAGQSVRPLRHVRPQRQHRPPRHRRRQGDLHGARRPLQGSHAVHQRLGGEGPHRRGLLRADAG